jgi:ABC-type multidrug transport system fused ATPase/permease subunit
MHDGQIVERGKHTELIARGGHYARVCELQFGGIT